MIRIATTPNSNSNHSRNRFKHRFQLFWWFLTFTIIVLFLALRSVEPHDNMIFYICIYIVIVIFFFIFASTWSFSAILGRQFDIFEIPIFLSVTSIFLIQTFGLAPYFDIKYLRVLPSVNLLPSGLILTGTGIFCMWLGYALLSMSYKSKPSHQFYKLFKSPNYSRTIFIYIVVLTVRLVLVALGSGEMILSSKTRVGGDWYQWFVYITELRWFFIALVSLQVFSKRWPKRILVFVIITETIMAVMSGWSSLLAKIVLLVFGCSIYARRKFSWRILVPVTTVVAVFVIFSVPMVRDLRAVRFQTGGVTISDINQSFKATWGKSLGSGWSLFSDLLIERQSATAQTPSILQYFIPKIMPYLPWQDLVVSPFTFIPRVLWPSKPVYTNLGSWLTTRVFGGEEGGSSAVTIVGNAYMYGGWFVMMISMSVLGVISAIIYRLFAIPGLQNNQMVLLAIYSGVVIANFHLGESDFISLWQGLVQRTLVFIIVAIILCVKSIKI